ncbi:MAG: hypothetical protein R3C30_00680 [Hyphomonadaceae bacterium]
MSAHLAALQIRFPAALHGENVFNAGRDVALLEAEVQGSKPNPEAIDVERRKKRLAAFAGGGPH